MFNLVKPAEGYGLDILVSATVVPTDEERRRLAALRRYEILDTPPDAASDRITALAADLFDVPISIISFADRDRIWFKSHHGLDETEIGRDMEGRATGSAKARAAAMPRSGPRLAAGAASDARSADLRSIAAPPVARRGGRRYCIAVPLRTGDGYDLGTLCVMDLKPISVNARRIRQLETLAAIVMDQLEVRLASRRAAAQAVIMAGENDHRTMNSLQFVASLLNLQSRAVHSTEAADQLTAAGNRVSAVARVHRTFAAEPNAERLPVLAYLRRLCGELADILETAVEIEGIEASIPTEQILALGLIANELVTNAKKHGAGAIKVTFTAAGPGDYELCVLDEGEGLPEDFTLGSSNDSGGLGLKVVAALVGQLQGRFSAHSNPAGCGACFRVNFPGS
jgi:two-component sensor histidine kinase